MAVSHVHATGNVTSSARARAARGVRGTLVIKVAGTLLLLVVVGSATGLILGHLLAAGIESLLDMIALDHAS